MLEAAGDLGLELKPGAVAGIVGELRADLLQSDVAVELAITGDEDVAEASFLVQPEYTVAVTGGRRFAESSLAEIFPEDHGHLVIG